MFNKKVIEIIENYGFKTDDVLIYFVSLYHGLSPSYIPDIVKTQGNITGIVKKDYNKGTVLWTVPLFDSNQQVAPTIEQQWEWVNTEYRKLFRDIDKTKGGDIASCTKKMKQFFAMNPEVRKEDILKATLKYITPFTDGTNDPKYMVRANYFISKIEKGVPQSRLSEYIEIVKEETDTTNKPTRGIW